MTHGGATYQFNNFTVENHLQERLAAQGKEAFAQEIIEDAKFENQFKRV